MRYLLSIEINYLEPPLLEATGLHLHLLIFEADKFKTASEKEE